MTPLRWMSLALLAWSASAVRGEEVVPAVAEVPPEAVFAAAADEIPGLVAELGDRDEAVRRRATARLVATGRPAIEPLAKAASAGSLEVRVRAVTILREIYVRGDDAAIDAAEAALERLAAQPAPSVASRAETVLATNYEVRERRAVSEIQKLGAIVEYSDQMLGDGSDARLITHVILGKDWTGGNDGLRHIKRLGRLSLLYYIPESGVTEEALKDVQAAVPNLQVQRRGRACLGVSCPTGAAGNGCTVMKLVPGSAAAKAGFQLGDLIVSFDGKPVKEFEGLINLIGETKPGDKVKVEVMRDFQRVTLEPVMDEWKKTDPSAETPRIRIQQP